jgi:hypothetical protein
VCGRPKSEHSDLALKPARRRKPSEKRDEQSTPGNAQVVDVQLESPFPRLLPHRRDGERSVSEAVGQIEAAQQTPPRAGATPQSQQRTPSPQVEERIARARRMSFEERKLAV